MAGQLVWRVFRAGAGHCPLMAATMAQWAATQRQSRASLGSLSPRRYCHCHCHCFSFCLPYLFNLLPTRCRVRPDPVHRHDHPQPQTQRSAANPGLILERMSLSTCHTRPASRHFRRFMPRVFNVCVLSFFWRLFSIWGHILCASCHVFLYLTLYVVRVSVKVCHASFFSSSSIIKYCYICVYSSRGFKQLQKSSSYIFFRLSQLQLLK